MAKTPLTEIKAATIELFKAHRVNAIGLLKQGRGGTSVALDIAVLHRLFAFGVKKGLMSQNPIHLENESEARKIHATVLARFTAQELGKLRKVAGEDLFTFLLLRWTGLRGSDAIHLQWQHIQFDRGVNGEIEMLTQKRSKTAIIPLSTELRNALEERLEARFKSSKVNLDDFVLYNPDTNKPFRSTKRLYERVKGLAERAGIGRATPHFFRDTFACDMLARGASIFDVAKMMADTGETDREALRQLRAGRPRCRAT